jgi:hypothetical protein
VFFCVDLCSILMALSKNKKDLEVHLVSHEQF